MSYGLFTSLYGSANALRAHSSALDIVGRNMANVNNPAYSRQRIVYGDKGEVTTALGTQSLGVEPVAIQQMRDSLLDKQVTEETAYTELFNSQQPYLLQAQSSVDQGIFGKSQSVDTVSTSTDLPSGLSSSLDAFFNAWQSFATKPSDSVGKQQLIANTDDLIEKIRLADQRLGDLSIPPSVGATGNTITGQMDQGATSVNGILSTLADLNRQIGRAEIGNPGNAVDLRDQRQAKLEELAKYIDFTTVAESAGQVGIQVSNGSGGTVTLLSQAVVSGSLSRNTTTHQYQWTPTGSATPQAVAFSAGRMAGYLQVGTTINGYRTQLDTFTNTLVTKVNTAYNSATNGDFFTSTGTTASTIARTATATTVVATDPTSPSGANDRALAVASLASNTTFLNGTPAQSVAKIVTQVGQDVSVNEARYNDQKTLGDLLKSQRDSYGGVSLDEETADMMRLQSAYQASAKIMSVIDELLSTIMNTLSR
jgi:flagellar hook-associated protein 1 FlgK